MELTIKHLKEEPMMSTFRYWISLLSVISLGIASMAGCSKHNNILDVPQPQKATVIVNVAEDSTGIPIKNANVVIYNANTNQAITRAMTDSSGTCSLFVAPNLPYYLKVTAQNYKSSPPPNGAPLPFEAGDDGSIVYRETALKKALNTQNSGGISGSVKTSSNECLAGCLVVALRQDDSLTVSGVSGPDGFFILYNVPSGTYEIQCFLAGWSQTTVVSSVQVASGAMVSGIAISLANDLGLSLSGRITFLASQNSTVDITLVHPASREAIPGLSTFNETSLLYNLDSIPPGTYIPWASYQNDGYVMDPDWIRKFGLPVVTFAQGDAPKILDFSITDAIPLLSPTNPKDTIMPVLLESDTPTFVWESYPSAHEYIVAVYDSRGDLIWGGYDSSGHVLHPQIDAQTTRVRFNFDGRATSGLQHGRLYRWKVWADKDAAVDVQQLISASEDLLGLFSIGEPPRR